MNESFHNALLVEDEPQLAEALTLSLKQLGISAKHVPTLKLAEEYFGELPEPEKPELILLDRMLPDGDGLTLCAQLRAQGYQGSILVLTASGAIEDRVKGLDAGADDYLPKPFSWDELAARVRALSRRRHIAKPVQTSARSETIWTCDESRLRILGPLGWVTLTPLEYRLAVKLISAPGTVVKREDLLKDVWGFKWLPQTRTVDYFLGRLRKHFEKNSEKPSHFVTVRGMGYRFEP